MSRKYFIRSLGTLLVVIDRNIFDQGKYVKYFKHCQDKAIQFNLVDPEGDGTFTINDELISITGKRNDIFNFNGFVIDADPKHIKEDREIVVLA